MLLYFTESVQPSQLQLADRELKSRHVVSTMPSQQLARLVPDLPHLRANPSVTVGLVNLAWRNPPAGRLVSLEGFGYLIPRSTPRGKNPHRALGVVFDSDIMPGLDSVNSTYTKLSVLMGGHMYESAADVPSKGRLIEQAIETVHLHLGIKEAPAYAMAHVQTDCIPQYTVGHVDRMRELGQALSDQPWNGRLSVAGASYGGVSVNDCVFMGQSVANRLKAQGTATGLERYSVM